MIYIYTLRMFGLIGLGPLEENEAMYGAKVSFASLLLNMVPSGG